MSLSFYTFPKAAFAARHGLPSVVPSLAYLLLGPL